MTRENYRTQMRAVFLAAIMVISVVGMSVAFTGAAAASSQTQPDFEPENPYQGQTVIASNSSVDLALEDYDLRIVDDYDNGTVDSSSFVEEISAEEVNNEIIVEIDTDDLEPGEDYFLDGENLESPRNVDQDETFEVREQRLDAEFDDDTVTDAGDNAETELEIDSNRGTYSTNVSADGDLDDDELIQIFAGVDAADSSLQNVTGEALGEHLTDENVRQHVDFNNSAGFENVTVDDDFFTADSDVGNLSDLEGITNTDEYADNFSFAPLAYQEDADDADEKIVLFETGDVEEDVTFDDIDAGDYTFDFSVVDTEATSSADITVEEDDADGSFSQGTYQSSAGDLAHFEFELEDTDETWIQVGDEDSDFVDVLYVEVDDEDDPVEVTVNTRLLGTSMTDLDGEDVYDVSNEDTIESAYHDAEGGDMDNPPSGGATVFEDDGTQNNSLDFYVDELGIADDAFDQLTRPLQATDYELQLAGDDVDSDEGLFDADAGAGEANDQLDSSVLELVDVDIGDIVTHTAPEESADDEDDVSELLDIVTQRDEIATDDRLIVQVEATGLYGSLIAGADDDDAADVDFDRLEDGLSTTTAVDAFDTENIDFEIVADETTGNQDPLEVDLGADDSETYMLIGPDQEQFFLVVDTSDDDAFDNGDAPDDDETFTATLEYDADNEDDRYEFESTKEPFSSPNDADNYPYLRQGEVLDSSAEFDLEPRAVDFDNLNEDDEVQAENIEDSEISGETNVAPGSDAEIRVSSTDASSSFRIGESVDINEDGEIAAEYDFSDQEAGDEFDTRFRAEGSTVDTVDSVIVEEGDLGVEDPVEDDEDDVVDDDDDVVDDDDDVVDDEEDDLDDDVEDVDDETPGFGAIVALVALIGAALLAVRRQN